MPKILVIDDDDAALKLVTQHLSRAGYAVQECVDGIRALGAIATSPPDLIVSDVQMPELDGYGLLSALRAQPATEAIPFILITESADHEGFRKGMKLGADDYLTKPVDRQELLDAVSARLARARAAARRAIAAGGGLSSTGSFSGMSAGTGSTAAASTGGTPGAGSGGAPAASDNDARAFTRLTDYTLVRKLAEGGMSSIFLADQKSTQRRVVLKMIPLRKGIEQDVINRFMQEHAMLERLRHPNVVEIYAQGFNDDHLYIAMEFFQHGSLNDIMFGALSEETSFNFAVQIARGLEAAHRQGIVHRDLKPDNIMVRRDKTLALTDFGIAKDLNSLTSMTVHGEVLGTPSYVAPEQALGQTVGPAADVYSLGVMLFQMLTGRKPYQANDPQNILYQHVNSPIPKLPDDLAQWQDLINFMMAKQPHQRPSDASAVLACFRALGME
jgi:eukaryotic-like serine/threonine-protein kinase